MPQHISHENRQHARRKTVFSKCLILFGSFLILMGIAVQGVRGYGYDKGIVQGYLIILIGIVSLVIGDKNIF